MMNELTYYIDPQSCLDALNKGRLLKVLVWGPKREYLQVAVVDKPPSNVVNLRQPASEPEQQEKRF